MELVDSISELVARGSFNAPVRAEDSSDGILHVLIPQAVDNRVAERGQHSKHECCGFVQDWWVYG